MANSYATHTELMNRLGIEENDPREGIFIDVLEAASRWIDKVTERRFFAVSETRYYTLCYPYTNGGIYIDIDDVLSVTTLQTDNNGDQVFETTWTSGTDYWLSPRNALVNNQPYTRINRNSLTGRFYFPGYEYGIAVTGSFGYSTLANRPSNIRELCLMVASRMVGPQLVGVPSLSGSTGSSALVVPGVQEYRIGTELQVKMATASDLIALADLPVSGQNIVNLYKRQSLVV